MHDRGTASRNLLIGGAILYVLLAILGLLGEDVLTFFFFFQLPGFVAFLAVWYLRRYLGSAAIAGFILLFSVGVLTNALHPYYYEDRVFSIVYLSLLSLANFLLLLSAGLLVEKGHLRERGIAALVNVGLGAAFILSLFYVVNLPCGAYPLAYYIPLYTLTIAALLFLGAVMFFHHLGCKKRPGDTLINLGLSLLSWGLVLVLPSMCLSNGLGAPACSVPAGTCTTPFYMGLFLFTLATLLPGAFIIGWEVGCRVRKNNGRSVK